MDTLSREQVDRLAEDIAFMKKAIEKNSSVLQQIDFGASLRLMCLLTALSVFVFSGLFHFLIRYFGNFSVIPVTVKAVSFCAMALVLIGLGIQKNFGILKSARSTVPGMSMFALIKEYYSVRMYHHFIPVGLTLLFLGGYAVATGNFRFLVPLLSIYIGLIYNSISLLLRIDDLFFSAYWFTVTGCIVLVFHTMSPLLALCLTLGCGLLLQALIWYLPRKKRAEG
jgi:hypothetical protein